MIVYEFDWHKTVSVRVPKVISFVLLSSSPLDCAFDVGGEVVCCSCGDLD